MTVIPAPTIAAILPQAAVFIAITQPHAMMAMLVRQEIPVQEDRVWVVLRLTAMITTPAQMTVVMPLQAVSMPLTQLLAMMAMPARSAMLVQAERV